MKTPKKKTAENFIKDIRRNTRRIFSSEQKIQIVMEAFRAEMSVAELCRKYSINESQFYKWIVLCVLFGCASACSLVFSDCWEESWIRKTN